MTAKEVIDEIRALDPEEQTELLKTIEEVLEKIRVRQGDLSKMLRELKAGEASRPQGDQLFDQLADQVLARHADLMRKLAQ